MTIKENIEDIKWGLKDLVEQAAMAYYALTMPSKAGNHLGTAGNIAKAVMPPAAMILVYGCGSNGGSSGGNGGGNGAVPDPNAPTDPQPGETPQPGYDTDGRLDYFYTGDAGIVLQGSDIVMAMTGASFKDRYNNDPIFNQEVNEMWRASVEKLYPNLAGDTVALDEEVSKYVSSLVNDVLPNLQDDMSVVLGTHDFGSGPVGVIEMYIDRKDSDPGNPDGIYLIINNQPMLIDNTTPITGVGDVVQHVEDNPLY